MNFNITRANLTGLSQIVFEVAGKVKQYFVIYKSEAKTDGNGGYVFDGADLCEKNGGKIGTVPAYCKAKGYIKADGTGVMEICN